MSMALTSCNMTFIHLWIYYRYEPLKLTRLFLKIYTATIFFLKIWRVTWGHWWQKTGSFLKIDIVLKPLVTCRWAMLYWLPIGMQVAKKPFKHLSQWSGTMLNSLESLESLVSPAEGRTLEGARSMHTDRGPILAAGRTRLWQTLRWLLLLWQPLEGQTYDLFVTCNDLKATHMACLSRAMTWRSPIWPICHRKCLSCSIRLIGQGVIIYSSLPWYLSLRWNGI